MPKENQEIQILRGLAILAVVGIHTLSIGISNTVPQTLGHYTYQFIHTLLQFAVPTFVFISALLITYPLQKRPFKPLTFYKNKLLKVGIPYVLWTLIYALIHISRGSLAIDRLWTPKSWAYWLLYGKAYDHLYYLSVTLQLYIVAPIGISILYLFNRFLKEKAIYLLFPLAILGQILVYMINKRYIAPYFSAQATLVIWYFIIIVLGMWAGLNYSYFITKLRQYIRPLIGFLVATTLTYLFYRYRILVHEKINTAFYQGLWYAYVLLMALCLLYLSLRLTAKPLGNTLRVIGNYSFGIYLIHPMMTYWLRQFIHTSHTSLLAFLLILSMAGMVILCILICKVLERYKYSAILLGQFQLTSPVPSYSVPQRTYQESDSHF